MKQLLIFISTALLFSSCCSLFHTRDECKSRRDSRKLDHLLAAHPEWKNYDTVMQTITVPGLNIHDTTTLQYTAQLNVDSMLDAVADSSGYMRKEDCKSIAENVYAHKQAFIPPKFIDNDSLVGKIYIYDGQIFFDLRVKERTQNVPAVITTIKPLETEGSFCFFWIIISCALCVAILIILFIKHK